MVPCQVVCLLPQKKKSPNEYAMSEEIFMVAPCIIRLKSSTLTHIFSTRSVREWDAHHFYLLTFKNGRWDEMKGKEIWLKRMVGEREREREGEREREKRKRRGCSFKSLLFALQNKTGTTKKNIRSLSVEFLMRSRSTFQYCSGRE